MASLVSVLASACASTGGTIRPFPTGTSGVATRAAPKAPALAAAVVETALGLRGVPYRDGGAGPAGFDCSGFTQYVFGRHGLALPREVQDQFRVGTGVTRPQLESGDLIFFSTTTRGPSHVAIAMGGGEFVHAPSASGVVRVERLDSRYWARRVVGIRRMVTR